MNQASVLSQNGATVADVWQQIPQIFPQVRLGAFVVMPNHLHGILFFEACILEQTVPEQRASPLAGGIAGTHNPMLGQSLGRVIRWFKGRATYENRKTDPTFRWQSRFHDRIIRNEKEFQAIAAYIQTNPTRWTP